MDKSKINEFSMRINQGNKSEIIVVLYDIFFEYLNDARKGFEEDDQDAFLEGIRRSSQVVEHLKVDLDFSYSISEELYPLYIFVQKALTRAMYKNDPKELDSAETVMKPLYEAFIEVAKADDSESVMQNAENIVAGYTYGRGDLNETDVNYDKNRGFLA